MDKSRHLCNTKSIFHIIGMAVGGVIIAMAMALLFGLVVMWLWNWLMPAIFGLTTISFWQAWGLVVLSHILFKSFPHHKEHGHHDEYWKRRFKDKFHPPAEEKANPEGDGIPEN